MHAYLAKKIVRTSGTRLLDLRYFARYQPQAGFKFALDGLHRAPSDSITYTGLYCLNPPGALYEEEIDDSKVQLTSLLNWEGPAVSPQWVEGFITYKDVPFEKNLHIIIDIRSVNFSRTTPHFSSIGWTICPVFSADGYVRSGLYQIPVFKGKFPPDLRRELQEEDPWPYLMEMVGRRNRYKLQFLESTTAMIRLVDAQREVHSTLLERDSSFAFRVIMV